MDVPPDEETLWRQVWINTGVISEADKRIGAISRRLDQHIKACSTRFFLLIAAMGVATTIIVAAVAWWHH